MAPDKRPKAYPVGSACARCGVGMPSGASPSWAGRSSRGAWRSFRPGSRPTRRVGATSWPVAGRTGSAARRAATPAATFLAARDLLQCRACRHQTSVTAGTVLDRTRLPLPLWFAAAYLVTTHTPGFSALQRCSASSGSPATRPPGRCCRSCGERWCDPSATGFRVPSSSTRPMSVGLRKGGAAAGSATARR